MKDPRYDAVGSSSRREELFNTFLKAFTSGSLSSLKYDDDQQSLSPASDPTAASNISTGLDRKARTERALRERQEQARAQKGQVEHNIDRSKAALTSVEAETELSNFFVDAVRDPIVCI